MFSKKPMIVVSLIIALSLILGACQPAAVPATEEPAIEEVAVEEPVEEEAMEEMEKAPIKFIDTMFQSLWINNAIAMYITEEGYGYPVESIEMTTVVAQQSIEVGDMDVFMENWINNYPEWHEKVTSEGTVIDLGNVYDKSTQGWYVPRYVIEGDAERGIEPMAPDLKSIDDLVNYKELFADPEDPDKGLLVNCIIGWQCQSINQVKVHAYGLQDDFNLLEPGAAAALDAAIAGAYKKGDPILSYYWEPTWLIGLYDMVQIEEPTYSDECWAEMIKVHEGEVDLEDTPAEAGCAYESVGIPKSVHASLAERAPEITAFLEKMNVGTDALNKTAAYMTSEESSAEEAAIWYLNTYPEKWNTWVTEEAKANIESALAAE
ncbi:MAG: hypothetical protein JEZ00_13565 [Anaerolineaceae bacterium]|nr:hypothetical protein [Anaerolineaceae bacterium]